MRCTHWVLNHCTLVAHTENSVFQQFDKLLSTDTNKLTLDEPLTLEDCTFLRQAYLSCNVDSTMLDLACVTKDEIQQFGFLFKALDGKNMRFIHLTCLFLFAVITIELISLVFTVTPQKR